MYDSVVAPVVEQLKLRIRFLDVLPVGRLFVEHAAAVAPLINVIWAVRKPDTQFMSTSCVMKPYVPIRVVLRVCIRVRVTTIASQGQRRMCVYMYS